jgi:hypothetical protein
MKVKLNTFTKFIGFIIVIIVVIYILFPWSKKNNEGFDTPLSTAVPTINANVFDEATVDSQFKSLFEFLYDTYQYSEEFKRRITEVKKIVENNDNKLVKIEDYKKIINELKKIIFEDNKAQTQIGGYLLRKLTQETRIDNLNNEINDLNVDIDTALQQSLITPYPNATLPPIGNETKKSIKCIGSGLHLNIKELDQTLLSETNPDGTYKINALGPNGEKRILIFLNNGCLTYDKTKEKLEDKYYVKICSLNNENQIFQMNQDVIGSGYKLIQPITDNNVCIALDLTGISIENITEEKLEQRWGGLTTNIPLCNKYESKKISLI